MDKQKKGFVTIDEYIAAQPQRVQDILQRIRRLIHKAAPDAVEAISYQMPTFKLKNKNLIHFAAWQKHIAIYPLPSGVNAFREELASYIAGRGTIQFPLDKPIPYDLIEKVVAYRVSSEAK